MSARAAEALLAGAGIFRDTPAETIRALADGAHARTFTAGQTVFAEGAPADNFYIVQSGEVRLFRWAPDGDEKVYQLLGPGHTLAEVAMFMDPPVYPMNACANRKTVLWYVKRQVLVDYCRRSPDFAGRVMASMARKISDSMDRIDHLTMNNAGQRLVAYLLDLHVRQRRHWLELPVGHADLAKQLAVTPETLSRLFGKLRRNELVTNERRTVVLLDIDALCAFAELPKPRPMAGAPGAHGHADMMVGCCSLR